MKISVVINTYNEEINIAYAIRSVLSWANEIIVVDMYSEDSTVSIAESYGAKVLFHEKMGFADPARAFAIASASGDWIFMLDADEMVPEALSIRLIEIATNDLADIVNISWANYLLGKRLRYSGWGGSQERHMRFFRKGFLISTDEIHNFLKPLSGARIHTLPATDDFSVYHFNYVNSEHFINKLNRYTTIEAEQAYVRSENAGYFIVIYKSIKDFAVRFIVKQGYKDGWRGFILSLYMSMYQIVKYGKLWELREAGNAEDIRTIYVKEAERLLLSYERSKKSRSQVNK